ncbi:MFS transporter [Saccharibacillus sacchari]|uniref:MFS transporter n=1 Tax=Saccharibacillus sacchari TaxID=456493 RepID=A0ACC6PE87_9BACL
MKHTGKIYLLTLITFVVSTSEGVIAGILDKVAASVNVPLAVAGQLITIFAIANAFGSPLVMIAAAKWNQRKVLIVSLMIMVIGCAATFWLSGFGYLMLSRVVLAIGSGVFAIAAKTAASHLAPPEKQAGAIGTILLGFSAAIIVGVPIGRVVAMSHDWRFIFVGIGLLSLLSIMAIMAVIPAKIKGEVTPIGMQLAYLKQPKILTGLAVTFFWQLGYGMMYAYITPFLLQVALLREGQISMALFAFGIATLIGSKFGGWMSDVVGNGKTLMGSLTVHALALVTLSVMPGSTFVTIPLLMVWSFSAWASGPGMQYNLIELAPQARGIMLGLYGSFIQLGIAAAGGIGGLASNGGSMRLVGLVAAASVTIALLLSRYSSRRSLKKIDRLMASGRR